MLTAVPKKKRKKADSLGAITHRLDSLVSKIVRLRDRRCVVCGSTQDGQCGHYIGRRHLAVRWDLTNCHQQCAGCNIAHNSNPVPYTLFIERAYGIGYPEKLNVKARERAPSRAERLALEIKLKALLEDMDARL